MVTGARSGTNYLLAPGVPNRIGRGIDCDVVLADPLCSRVHAEVYRGEDGWRVRDAGSRNGTFVNDEQIEDVLLPVGARVRLGSTEFTFHNSDQPPTLAATQDNRLAESIVREAPVDTEDSGQLALAALRRTDNAHELMVFFQLSVKLLGCEDPDQVQLNTLELIQDRTGAEVVGFLWVTEEGELKPQMCVPAAAQASVRLSHSLTQIVLEQRRAVWVANQSSAASPDSLRAYADALCVPVLHDGRVLGALHLYLGTGRFRDIDFELAISAAQLLGVALARSRRQAALVADHQRLVESSAACDEIIGDSEAMRALKLKITRIAVASGAVLICGESGSGKELVARAVHRASSRADRPLLAVNCAAIPASLVESQLFGHVKGAFTGAVEDRRGWFEQAHTGTLFLDEIGELSLEAQAKLLRVLEGHSFQPVGGTRDIRVDVRILAATNRELNELVSARRFREDLYYRLSVFELRVPPLRERDVDIDRLIDHFLNHFVKRHGRPGLRLSDVARKKLRDYAWPGNVRQLRNVIDSAVVLANGQIIQADDLGLYDAGTDHLETLRIDEWERKLIRKALERAAGNVPHAAQLLGIGRATLYRKIDEYQIDRR
jgi:Nif-specific regulatory protein